MKFVALLSGGKDSCFNIMKCVEYGHELIALANLYPEDPTTEEVNSFMYQSAGHTVIPLFSQCFGVPLYRQAIKGTAVAQSLEYGYVKGDEVEDLFELLSKVKEVHPDVKGVGCGAIVSTYQRLRVENVCLRLGLVPLSYTWLRDRNTLLNDIIDSNIHAVTVKVAGAGLDPFKHLGKPLHDLMPVFVRLHNKLGLDLCGEGGEYESLVLDCPLFEFYRIELSETDIVLDDEDTSVGNLRIGKAYVVPKQAYSDHKDPKRFEHRHAHDCGVDANEIKQEHEEIEIDIISSQIRGSLPYIKSIPTGLGQTEICFPKTCGYTAEAIRAQMNEIIQLLQQCLRTLCPSHAFNLESQRLPVEFRDVLFFHLYISDMGFFSIVNEEYCKAFGSNPPSRSCVAIPLPYGVAVAADITFLQGSMYNMVSNPNNTLQRRVLHVQSQSSWAPLCIGPYSQAQTIYNTIIFLSGQIALDPSTMNLIASPSFEVQTAQCVKNISRILVPLHSNLLHMLTLTAYVDVYKVKLSENEISETIKRILEEHINDRVHISDLDGHAELSVTQGDRDSDEDDDNDNDDGYEKGQREAKQLSQKLRIARMIRGLPINIIKVESIPRSSMVELEAVCVKANKEWSDKDGDESNDDGEGNVAYGDIHYINMTYMAEDLKGTQVAVDPHEGIWSSDIYSWDIFLPGLCACVPDVQAIVFPSCDEGASWMKKREIHVESSLAFKSESYAAGCMSVLIEKNVFELYVGYDDSDGDKRIVGTEAIHESKEFVRALLELLLRALIASLSKADVHMRFLLTVKLFVPTTSGDFSPTASERRQGRLSLSQLKTIQDDVHTISVGLGMRQPLNVVVVPASETWSQRAMSSHDVKSNDNDHLQKKMIGGDQQMKMSFLAVDLLRARSEAWIFRGE